MCNYGNNQHELTENITEDLHESGFTKIIHVVQGHIINILHIDDIVFSRICYMYELFLTLIDAQKANNENADGEILKRNTKLSELFLVV